jgi:hypothetical protein
MCSSHRLVRGLHVAVITLAVIAATGCGGEASPEHQAESAVAASLGGVATCSEEGWMVFVGERETVYGCAETGSSTQSRCYVVIEGKAQDVTDDLVESIDHWPCAAKRRAALLAEEQARQALSEAKQDLARARADERYWIRQGAEEGSLAQRATAAAVLDASRRVTEATNLLNLAERALADTEPPG